MFAPWAAAGMGVEIPPIGTFQTRGNGQIRNTHAPDVLDARDVAGEAGCAGPLISRA